jgi:hypothetical protein
MKSICLTAERPDLGPVFGLLPVDHLDAVISSLGEAEECLLAFRDSVIAAGGTWHSRGITLDTYPSGQASITGYVESPDGLSFGIELAPQNFWDGEPWQPGNARKVMSHEAWDVTGEVRATPDRHGNHVVAELPVRHRTDPEAACAALREACAELRQLAFSRPLTNEAWLNANECSA